MPTKVCIVKAMAFPVVLYGCESWTIKKAEHRRINAFFGAWRILKEINPACSLEGQMLKLKLQYFGLMGRADLLRPWCWERLKAGGGHSRGWDGWMASQTQWTMHLSNLRETVKEREAWRAAIHDDSQTQLRDWIKTILIYNMLGGLGFRQFVHLTTGNLSFPF